MPMRQGQFMGRKYTNLLSLQNINLIGESQVLNVF